MLRSIQRVMGLFSKKRQQSPSGSASGKPCAAATATTAYEIQEKDLGRLHRMAARGDLAWLRRWRWWLKRGGMDRQDKEKRTPLHLASANGHADVVRFLIRKNCQLNLADNFKRSPLMKAVQCQQEECVAVLLKHGADPNLADADGNTALHLAVLSPNTAVAGLLLEHNANTDAQNQDGYTPLNLALSKHHEEMVVFLQRKGADGQAPDQHESNLLVESRDGENVEESPAGDAEDEAVLSSSHPVRTADLPRTALAQDTGGALPVGAAEQEEDAECPGDFEVMVTQLQQQLADALTNQGMLEASLEIATSYHSDLEEDKLRLQKELDRIKTELWELEEEHFQSEHCVHDLKSALDEKEREVIASFQKLQDLVLASSGTNATIKQLEEDVQRLEIENASLEATVQQQNNKIEALQRDLQASASHGSKEQQGRTLAVGICIDELQVCEELKIHLKLQKDCDRLSTLLERAMKTLRVHEEREMESQLSFQGEMKNSCSEMVNEGARLRTKLRRQRCHQSEDAGAKKSHFQKTRSGYTESQLLPPHSRTGVSRQ